MNMRKVLWFALLAMLAATPAWAQNINAAGATFPYPIYSKWFDEYHKLHPNVQINYQSIGSGGGIRQLLDKTVDFGASGRRHCCHPPLRRKRHNVHLDRLSFESQRRLAKQGWQEYVRQLARRSW